MNKFALAAIFAVASSVAPAVPGTLKTETDTKTGDIKWQPGQKSYLVTLNKGNVQAEYKLADVVELDIAKPANLDKLVEQVSKGQGAMAIPGLTAIVQNYRMLQWDKAAARYLVEAYIAANQAQKAFDTAQTVIRDDKSAAYMGELAPAYWQSLLKLGKTQQLENCLRMATSNGDRASSGEALIMRGDIILANGGDTPDAYRQALTDAYLRVGLMYSDPKCRLTRRSALLKCAECFRKLGMDLRAENMESLSRQL